MVFERKASGASLCDDRYGERLCHAPDGVLVNRVSGPLVARAAVHGEGRHATGLHHTAEGQGLLIGGQQPDLTCTGTPGESSGTYSNSGHG